MVGYAMPWCDAVVRRTAHDQGDEGISVCGRRAAWSDVPCGALHRKRRLLSKPK
jgi:hypothetical protein